MNVCQPPVRTTPPAETSSMHMNVSVRPSMKVGGRKPTCPRVEGGNQLLLLMLTCSCAGRHCEIYKDPCLKVHCSNRGYCDSAGLNASCVCPPGYLGES